LPEERAEVFVRQAIDSARGTLRERIRSTRRRLTSFAANAPAPRAMKAGADIDRLALERVELDLRALQSQAAALREGLAALEKKAADVARGLRTLRGAPRKRGA
jgi:hypothetical protein